MAEGPSSILSGTHFKATDRVINLTALDEQARLKWISEANKMPLKFLEEVWFFPYEMDIFTGVRKVKSTNDLFPSPDGDTLVRFRGPMDYLDELEKKRFYLMTFLFESFVGNRKASALDLRIIEAGIRASSDRVGTWSTPSACLLEPNDLCGSAVASLAKIWTNQVQIGREKILYIVGDTLGNREYHLFTGKTPSYTRITAVQAIGVIKKWVSNLFKEHIPKGLDGTRVYEQLLDQLNLVAAISKAQWQETYVSTGLNFLNVHVQLEKGNPQPVLREYGPDLVSGENLIQDNYTPWKLDKDAKIILSDTTLNYLKIITNDDPYRYNIYRAFCRALISARIDGDMWQNSIYLYGPPGTGKTALTNVFKKMVSHPEHIVEFSRTQNQFSSAALENCQLLIISDVGEITTQMMEVLRPLLGRDELATQQKFEQGQGRLKPKCQVIFTSNHPPSHYPLLRNEPGIMDKFSVVEMKVTEVVPPHLRKASFADSLDMVVVDMMNWGMTAPKKVMQNFIRSTLFSSFLDQRQSLLGFGSFLEQYFYWSTDTKDFVAIIDILPLIETYVARTGDDSLKPKRASLKGNTEVGALISAALFKEFGKTSLYKKCTLAGSSRKMGFSNLVPRIKGPNEIAQPQLPHYSLLKVRAPRNVSELPDPFKSENKIIWYQSESSELKTEQLKLLKWKARQEELMKEFGYIPLSDDPGLDEFEVDTISSILENVPKTPDSSGVQELPSKGPAVLALDNFVRAQEQNTEANEETDSDRLCDLWGAAQGGASLLQNDNNNESAESDESFLGNSNIAPSSPLERPRDRSVPWSPDPLMDCLNYTPNGGSFFSKQGEIMVNDLVEQTPEFHRQFNDILSLEVQQQVATETFNEMALEWKAQKQANLEAGKPNTAKGTPYFESRRTFGALTSPQYRRTAAPRLSTPGTTFSGMATQLLVRICKKLSLLVPGVFLDLDMSACHTRIASSLILEDDNPLRDCLSDGDFWNGQVALMQPIFEEFGITLPDSLVKKVLKVVLYTCLNGGRSLSPDRIWDNVSKNLKELVKERGLNEGNFFGSDLHEACLKAFGGFKLALCLEKLNKACGIHQGGWGEAAEHLVYTLDRELPYTVKSAHMGISRVLQGFEVTVLSILVDKVRLRGGIPVSLAHDGVLAYFPEKVDPLEISAQITAEMKPWMEWLRLKEMPIEAKRMIFNGEHTEDFEG